MRDDESAGFSHVATGDESLFLYYYQSTHCWVKSRVEVPPRMKTTNATKEAIVTIFLTGGKFLIFDPLSREEKFNQNHFLAVAAP
jgi:hypothetical protein